VAYIFTILPPTNLDGSIIHRNIYGEINIKIGPKISVGMCDNRILEKYGIFIKSAL
jgi:hypothetical protein